MREGAHSGVLSLAKQVSAGPREAWQHGRVHVDTVGSVEGTMLAVSALFSYAVCVCVFGGAGKLIFPNTHTHTA